MKQYPVNFTALANGETLAWRQGGSGEVIVFLHGNMSSSVHWQSSMEALENDFSVFAPDLRGFGDSTYVNKFDSLLELAQDVKMLLDAQKIDKFSVVGWSTGGGIALELAALMPDAVKKVFLLNSVALTGYPMFKKDAQGKPVLTDPILTKDDIASDPVQVMPVLNAYAKGDKNTMRAIWNGIIYNMNQPPEAAYELYLEAMLKQRNLVDVNYSLMTFNMTDSPTMWAEGSGRMSGVKCPIVVLQGEKDIVVPPIWANQIAEAFGSQAKLITFPNAGHSPITDDFDGFINAIKANI
ncbi:MAG: alpha/beta hydrolase [Defluviitaleaceae bacterium]|nr:alpha/beta hydrolase [Defluviitaleaceae bacterium]